MEFYLLRHGRTTQPGTYTGLSDAELSDTGRNQIRSLQPFFSNLSFDHCFCSPLVRCRETFKLLDIHTTFTIDKNLQEIHFGRWEGLSFDQIEERFPGQIEQWSKKNDDFRFPGGDSITEFNGRVCLWIDKLLTKNFNRVLIVSHAGVLRSFICHLLGIGPSHAFAFNVREGQVTKLTVTGGFGRLDFFNCTD